MEVNEFVLGQKAGGSLEDEGDFTLSLEDMSSRFATFQAENQGYYLLRLIQSLVRGGARAVEIRSTRRSLEITVPEFATGPDWLRPDVLVELLQQPGRWNRVFQGVAVAFLCMRSRSFQHVEWLHGGRRLSGDPSLAKFLVEDAPVHRDELCVKVRKPFPLLLSATAMEHSECLSRVASTTTPITFDGFLLKASTPVRRKSTPKVTLPVEEPVLWFTEYTREFALIEAETTEPPETGWVALSGRCGKWEQPDGWAQLKLFLPGDDKPYAHVAISPRLEGKSRIWPILDGVIATGPIESEKYPALEGYVDAPESETDLSGLAVIDGQAPLEAAARYYRSMLLQLRDFSHLLEASWDLTYPGYPLSLFTTAIVGISCMGGFLQPVIAVPPAIALDVMASRLRFEKNRRTFTEKFRREVAERVESLLQRTPRKSWRTE